MHDALGEYPGFIVGWTDWLATCGSMAAVAMVLGEYVGPSSRAPAAARTITASSVVMGFALLQWRGIRIGDAAQQITSLAKCLALIGLAAVALVMRIDSGVGTVSVLAPTGFVYQGPSSSLQSAIYTYDGWTGPIYW